MSNFATQLELARAQFAVNARLRLGVWLILIIGIGYLLLVQSDRIAEVRADYAGEIERLHKAQALSTEAGWEERLAGERSQKEALEAALWQAETEGLAQASLQTTLTEMTADLDIRNARIRSGASQPVPELPGIWQIQAQLEGTYRNGAELQLLYAIARHPSKLVIDRLDLSRQNSRMLVLVSAYFSGLSVDDSE